MLRFVGTFAGAACATLALGLIFRWIDRKVTALVQWRVGPPWYQPLADDIASVAYWYQQEPHAAFPGFPGLEKRWPR